jgi:hypothetical protein
VTVPRQRQLREEAIALHRAGKLADARKLYAAYLAGSPRDAAMWSNYGSLMRSEGRHSLALLAQERAVALDPDGVAQMGNLANALSDLGQYERAVSLREAVLRRNPADTSQKAMIGRALRSMGRYDEGIAWLEQACHDHPGEHELRIQLALTQLAAGRYADGFRNYEVRWLTGELKPRQLPPTTKWQGDDLTGRSILVMPEQGFGDAVTFARFLPELRRFNPARVMLLCERPLMRVFAGVEGVDWMGPEVGPEQPFDVWTNMMDLPPLHFDRSDVIPAPTRLTVPEDSRERARMFVAPHAGMFKVGVVWCGSVTYRGNAYRSFSHTEFHRLLDLPRVQLFSLYKGPELAAFQADGTSAFIVDTASTDRDFADCAAMMMEMDLIVTSDTVTVHLAGSLGRPVWTLLHWDAFWLWQLERDRTPWYPGMRLIRQETPRDWAGVMARVKQDLATLVGR